jgi:hypothetical protein
VTESYGWETPLDDVEALVRSAGEYVRASDDLRPRVLEAARLQHGERRAKRRIRFAAAGVLILAFCQVTQWCSSLDRQSIPSGILVAAGFHELLSPTQATSVRSGDGDWRMIDAFMKLRRHQAQVLGCEI